MSYDSWKTTPPEPDRHCPWCGSTEVSFDPATPGDSGLYFGIHTNDETAKCLSCGWTGWNSSLMTAAEMRDEARLEQAGL